MKQLTYLLTAALGVFLAASCALNQLEEPVQRGQEIVFTASAAQGGPGTKTTLVDNGPFVYWSPGDKIAVYLPQYENYYDFTSTNTEPSRYADFRHYIVHMSAGDIQEGNEFWALYPYSDTRDAISFDGQSVTATEPYLQKAAAGTFDPSALLTVARSNSHHLPFYNVCGGLKLKFRSGEEYEDERIDYVELRSNDGTPLAGKATIRMDGDGIPYVDAVEDASDVVYLEAPEGGFVPGEWYYLVCLPAVLEQGYTLTFRNGSDQVASYVCLDPIEIERSVWGTLVNPDPDHQIQENWVAADTPRYNEIWYGTIDGNKLDIADGYLNDAYHFGAKATRHAWFGDWGFIAFDGPVTKLPGGGPLQNSNLEWISLPATLRTIGNTTFFNSTSLSEVNLPDGLLEIGEYAFQNCLSLQEIRIPGSVEKMGRGVFGNCLHLTAFTGPLSSADGRCVIRDGELLAFAPGTESGESLTEYAVPEGVTRLGNGCFAEMWGLETVSLPASIQEIGADAFVHCTGLAAFEGASPFISPDRHLLIQDGEIVAAAVAGTPSLTIPGTVNAIAPRAFSGAWTLESLTIVDGLTKIGDMAFENCYSLETVSLPNSLTELGINVFYGCVSLRQFSGKYATSDGLFLVRNGELITAAFGGVGDEVTIPASVIRIGDSAFETAGITKLILPDSVTDIGSCAFMSNGSLASIEFGSGLRTIGDNAFWSCASLTGDLSLPEGLQSIGWSAFGCTGLTGLTLPASLTRIVGGQIVYNCEDLAYVKIKAVTPPSVSFTDPLAAGDSCPIYVPEASRENYMAALGWSNYASRFVGYTE